MEDTISFDDWISCDNFSSSPLASIGLRHQGQQSQSQLTSDAQQERLILELQYLKKYEN